MTDEITELVMHGTVDVQGLRKRLLVLYEDILGRPLSAEDARGGRSAR